VVVRPGPGTWWLRPPRPPHLRPAVVMCSPRACACGFELLPPVLHPTAQCQSGMHVLLGCPVIRSFRNRSLCLNPISFTFEASHAFYFLSQPGVTRNWPDLGLAARPPSTKLSSLRRNMFIAAFVASVLVTAQPWTEVQCRDAVSSNCGDFQQPQKYKACR
jgi:hypothetical protein